MTFTKLTRQWKDVRNVKYQEEEEWYYSSASYLFVLLRCPIIQCWGKYFNDGTLSTCLWNSSTPLCSNNTWTFQSPHEQADQDTSQLTLRRSMCCFIVQLAVPFEIVCTPELIVLCLCKPKVMTLTSVHAINFSTRLQRAYSSWAVTWSFDIWSSTSSIASYVEAWSATCVKQISDAQIVSSASDALHSQCYATCVTVILGLKLVLCAVRLMYLLKSLKIVWCKSYADYHAFQTGRFLWHGSKTVDPEPATQHAMQQDSDWNNRLQC